MKYEEIRIELSVDSRGRFKTRVSLSGASSIESPFVPPKDASAEALFEEWFDSFSDNRTPEVRRSLEKRRRDLGESLFSALFRKAAPQLRQKLLVLRLQGQHGAPAALRLRLIQGDARGKGKNDASLLLPASSLPFEMMIDPESERFLVHHRNISLVRTLGLAEAPLPLRVAGALKVLVVTAQPEGQQHLNWGAEVARIREALRTRQETSVEVLANASFEQAYKRLRDGFHIFHFIGHGGWDPGSEEGYLLFEKDGKEQAVLAQEVAHRLGVIPTLRVAMLHACHTGELGKATRGTAVASVATALAAHGVPAVVGMQIAVTDTACIEFSGAFYNSLREDPSIERALADGRAEIPPSSPEWATQVLYLRGESSDLFDFKPDTPTLVASGAESGELALGIRTFVQSEKFPHLAAWAKRLEATTEKLLALEESFEGRFIKDPKLWAERVLPRLNRFFAQAVEQERPLALSLAAHGTVAFAAGYYFHSKSDTKVALLQVTAGKTVRWSAGEGDVPTGRLWQEFEVLEKEPGTQDIAVAVQITQTTPGAVEAYLAESRLPVGKLVIARITGEPGTTRVESGAHAYQLAWKLQEYLKDNTGNRGERRLHLFIAAPNGFNFYLGQLAQTLGALRLYEYNFEGTGGGPSTYEPSLDLPPSAPE